MLVLSRKIGERIHIGEEIFVEVRRVAGNRVTLAVNAPRDVRILRGELFEAAGEFDVLNEPATTESAKDTVIMKHNPVESNDQESVVAPMLDPERSGRKVHAK